MNSLKRQSAIAVLIAMFFTLLASMQVVAQVQAPVCSQSGTVTLPASPSLFFLTSPFTVLPGQTVTLNVTGSAAFQSGFVPGPGGGSFTTFTNTSGSPVTTQAAIIATTGGTFSWTLTGVCAVAVPTSSDWGLMTLAALLFLTGVFTIRRKRFEK